MKAHDALKISMDMSDFVLKTYVEDLTDAELMTRGYAGVNHLAWQLGHLIHSEWEMLNKLIPGAAIQLPSGFGEQHSRGKIGVDDSAQFLPKARYLELYDRQRAASKAALDRFSEADLDKPGPADYQSFAPTVGAVFNLIATHPLMHDGQFVIARRKLGKPITI